MIASPFHTAAGHGPDLDCIAPGRTVVTVPGRTWLYPPAQCPMGNTDTEWLDGGSILVCVGCGLDGT